MKQPLLSVVIVTYNYGRFLETAIRSVLDQKDERTELIVIDGGSTDGSQEIIRKYQDQISYWVSEPDKGQSDAFNKGFARATGKYLTWLNADDLLVPGCLPKILKELEKHPECEWFTGNYFRFTEDGKVFYVTWGPHCIPRILQRPGMTIASYGPTSFFTKELFNRMGGMKVYQHMVMDSDLWRRFICGRVFQRRISTMCWAFRMHEYSKTAEFGEHKLSPEKYKKLYEEDMRSLKETGYKGDRKLLFLLRIWRILDGSFLKAVWLKNTFKRVNFPIYC